jgi:hypothetical protein
VPGVVPRDTGAVVRELFASATTSVLVVGYAVHQGRRVLRMDGLVQHFDALTAAAHLQPVPGLVGG